MKVILVFALAVVFASSAWTTQPSLAQEKFKSGISGRVTDIQGAVVVDAWIRVVRRSTKKVVQEIRTSDIGEYAVDVEADVYEVEAEAVGFKKAKRKYIPVSSEGRNLVDFVLEPAEN